MSDNGISVSVIRLVADRDNAISVTVNVLPFFDRLLRFF